MLYNVSHQDFDTWQKKNAETSEMHGITTLNKQQVGMLQDEALAGTSQQCIRIAGDQGGVS